MSMRSRREGWSTVLFKYRVSVYAFFVWFTCNRVCPVQLTRSPHQMRPLIFPFLKVGHDAIHNMWLRREEVEGFDIAVRRSSVGDLFDI